MKIILRETYENLGRTGDVVEVKDGFARNFLVPQGIAYPQTNAYKKRFEREREELLRRDELARVQAEETAGKAAGVDLEFTVKIGDRGKMFGAITNANIADKLKEKGIEVDRRKIGLPEPIKVTGEHRIPVKLHGEVGFTVNVKVIPEAIPEDELSEEQLELLAEAQKAIELSEGGGKQSAEVVEMEEVPPAEESASPEEGDSPAESAETGAGKGEEEDSEEKDGSTS